MDVVVIYAELKAGYVASILFPPKMLPVSASPAFELIDTTLTSFCQDPLHIVIAGTASVILAQPSHLERRIISRIQIGCNTTADMADFESALNLSKEQPQYLAFSWHFGLCTDPEESHRFYAEAVSKPDYLLWSGSVLCVYGMDWDQQLIKTIHLAAPWYSGPGGGQRPRAIDTIEHVWNDANIREALDVVLHVLDLRALEGILSDFIIPTSNSESSPFSSEEMKVQNWDVEFLQYIFVGVIPETPLPFDYHGERTDLTWAPMPDT